MRKPSRQKIINCKEGITILICELYLYFGILNFPKVKGMNFISIHYNTISLTLTIPYIYEEIDENIVGKG